MSTMKKPAALVYGSEDRPPLAVTVLAGIQHAGVNAILLLFPLLVSREGGLSAPQIGDVLSTSMLLMAAASVIQAYPVGPVGAGLFCPAIFTAIYLGPSLAAVKAGGM
jgi:NCS2 family nucleobase:cation symporter-2